MAEIENFLSSRTTSIIHHALGHDTDHSALARVYVSNDSNTHVIVVALLLSLLKLMLQKCIILYRVGNLFRLRFVYDTGVCGRVLSVSVVDLFLLLFFLSCSVLSCSTVLRHSRLFAINAVCCSSLRWCFALSLFWLLTQSPACRSKLLLMPLLDTAEHLVDWHDATTASTASSTPSSGAWRATSATPAATASTTGTSLLLLGVLSLHLGHLDRCVRCCFFFWLLNHFYGL